MNTDENRLLTLLAGAARRGEFVLSSGRSSDFYINGKMVTLTPEGLELIGRIVWPLLLELETAALGGPSSGADPMVGALGPVAWRAGHPLSLFFVRKAAKGYGARQRVEGPPLAPGTRTVLIEDVVTTGGSLVSAVEAVREATEANVVATICLVDREEGGLDALEAAGAPLRPLFSRRDLEPLIP